jgi:twitching motility protein PilT
MAAWKSGDRERRTYRRVPLRLPVRYREEGTEAGWQAAITQDLSAVGLLLDASATLPLGRRLTLLLPVPEEERSVEFVGMIVRTEYRDDGKGYLLGLTFIDLTDAQRAHLSSILHGCDVGALLQQATEMEATDLHLSANHPPMIRVSGRLTSLRKAAISPQDLKYMIYTLLDERQRQAFERDLELNISLSVQPTVRFRVNVHSQRGCVEAAFRRIAPVVHSTQELNLPQVIDELADLADGLVLVTGRSGAGKTTTLAAMVDRINTVRSSVIVTLENPIEYVYAHKKSLVKQREIGVDTHSIDSGLREAMRQNPDVIVVGEVLDEATVKGILQAAESGHLVLATMAAGDSVQGIARLVNFFRKERQQDAQQQLSNCLRAIVYQRLVPRADAQGLVPATEVLVNTQAVNNLIRTGNWSQIPSVIQVSMKQGMHTLDSSLARLQRRGLISRETLERHRLSLGDLQPA